MLMKKGMKRPAGYMNESRHDESYIAYQATRWLFQLSTFQNKVVVLMGGVLKVHRNLI